MLLVAVALATAVANADVCCEELFLRGGEDLQPYAMGTYKRVPGVEAGSRPIWGNREGMYMYYSSDYHTWQVGESYDSDETGLVSDRDDEASCPHLVVAWKIWTDEGVSPPTVECKCKDELTSAFWNRKLALDRTNLTLQSMVGLTLGLELGLSSPKMREMLVTVPENDWVAQLYMAEHHFTNALEVIGNRNIPSTESEVAAWTGSLALAIQAWSNAELHRPQVSEKELARMEYNHTYPQSRLPIHKRGEMLEDWGTALQWSGREDDAVAVFTMGYRENIWHSPLCRPQKQYKLHPSGQRYFFPATAFPVVQHIQAHISEMQGELARFQKAHGGNVGDRDTLGGFNDGVWTQLNLIQNGAIFDKECEWFPKTCALITSIPELFLKVGQTKLSRLGPGARIWPHCGPTNSRLRIHCALSVPQGENGENNQATFWVGSESRQWVEGECLVFQESCEHKVEVKDTAAKDRIVLIADIANPFLDSFDDYFDAFEPYPEDTPPSKVQQEMSEASIAAIYATSQKTAVAAMQNGLNLKDEL